MVSVGVLPFVTLGGDEGDDEFARGLADEMAGALSAVSGIHVAAASPDETRDVREVGAELGVEAILRGSVRKSGDRARVSIQLVNVDDGYHRWTETFDRELDDPFAVQEEVASAIAEKMARRERPVIASGVVKSIAYRPRDGEDMRETERCRVKSGRGLERENRPGGR